MADHDTQAGHPDLALHVVNIATVEAGEKYIQAGRRRELDLDGGVCVGTIYGSVS